MILKRSCLLMLLCMIVLPVFAQTSTPQSPVSLYFVPGLSIPVGRDSETSKLGGGSSLIVQLRTPDFPLFALEAGGGFIASPLDIPPGEDIDDALLYLFSPRLGIRADYELFPRLFLGAHLHGGYYFASLTADTALEEDQGQNPLIHLGGEIKYRLLPSLSLGLDVSYRNFLGLFNDVAVSLGATYYFKSQTEGLLIGPQLKPYSGLEVGTIEISPVFPVFYKYYDENPIGSFLLRNTGKIPLEDVKVKVFVNQYMDNPNICWETEYIKGGDEKSVDLYALFNDRVMGISESTKMQINISVESSVAGENFGNETVQTLRVYDRNATTWQDDRRAAAFVTLKDPTVLKFSKNIASMTMDKGSRAINGNFLTAIAFHEALRLYGVSYVIDPTTPFIEFHQKKMAVDYLQFPNQTLEYKAGDCDDLSILYCALLESVGVETAFITIPGHIYMALNLNLSRDEAAKRFMKIDDLIVIDDDVWLPVEITVRDKGFLDAWAAGAKQWREHEADAQLIPVRSAWEVYEPVGFSGDVLPLTIPDENAVSTAFLEEVMKFIDRELYPQVSRIQKQIDSDRNNPRLINSLGVLYARYGVIDKAEIQFKTALEKSDYVPAILNLGNIFFLEDKMDEARGYYERAYSRQRDNAKILLALAKVQFETGDYKAVADHYARLEILDSDLAARFSYLKLDTGDSTARASEARRMKGEMVWED